MKSLVHVALLTVLVSSLSYGEEKNNHHGNEHVVGVEALSPDLRDLLSKEMQALQSGMMSIIPAFVSGNWSEIATTAGKMKNSYILKQSLTESQASELHSVLPPVFVEKDQRFHYLAGMLEHAAKNKKPELINFYFSEMNESCVNCHTMFARHKFPALSPREQNGEHRH
jgi:hypothetical protein